MTRERTPLDSASLRPFLPMLYVAWADGDLSVEEAAEICPQLDESAAERVGPWLDPAVPPSPIELQRMLAEIRRHAEPLAAREKLDLVGLGLAMAQADDRVGVRERAALERLQDALGVGGTEAARQLLTTRRKAARVREPEPAFPPKVLRDHLDGRYGAIRQRVWDVVAGFDRPLEPTRAEQRRQVLDWLQDLADADLGSLSFPKEYGGAGDLGAFITAFETLAYFDGSLLVKFGVQFGLWGGSVLNLGTEEHHARLLPAIGSMELPGCFAMTETLHGSNVADLETVAHFDPATQEFIVDTPHRGARKNYIGNAARDGRAATVFAQLDLPDPASDEIQSHGVHAFVVPIRDEAGAPLDGVTIGDDGPKMGLNGVDNGWLEFDHVRIPRANLLDRFASVSSEGVYSSPIVSSSKRFFTMLGTLVGGRVSVALGALSFAKSSLAIAVRYGLRRRQFGPAGQQEIAILDYPTHQLRLLPRLATTYALHFALHDLRDRFVSARPEEAREVETLAAGLKAYSTWHCTDTVQTGREATGGQGYLAENRFAALKADSDVFTTFEGDNMVLLQLVGKSLLGDYKRQFHDMKMFGLARFVVGRAASAVLDRNPIVSRLSSAEHLRDRGFHQSAFEGRERYLVDTLASGLKKRLDAGVESHEAILEYQDHLVRAAKAHVERLVFDSFVAGIARCSDDATRAQLERMGDLYALSRLDHDAAFFLENGFFEPSKSKAIREQVVALCAEIRPQALHWVDAFGIPPQVLGAPIAR